MVKIDMVHRLQQFRDLKNEVSSVEAYLKSKIIDVYFLPRYKNIHYINVYNLQHTCKCMYICI